MGSEPMTVRGRKVTFNEFAQSPTTRERGYVAAASADILSRTCPRDSRRRRIFLRQTQYIELRSLVAPYETLSSPYDLRAES